MISLAASAITNTACLIGLLASSTSRFRLHIAVNIAKLPLLSVKPVQISHHEDVVVVSGLPCVFMKTIFG